MATTTKTKPKTSQSDRDEARKGLVLDWCQLADQLQDMHWRIRNLVRDGVLDRDEAHDALNTLQNAITDFSESRPRTY